MKRQKYAMIAYYKIIDVVIISIIMCSVPTVVLDIRDAHAISF